ncbi:MAG: tRNA 2-thiouridine(34) synthase MnmA [bacterium]
MRNRKRKVALALSGGIDSAVAGMLLQKQGYDLTALYLKLFAEDTGENQARIVAEFFKMPFYAIDVRTEFKNKIIDYFLEEYKNGWTPNPCVRCNRDIKFGILYDKAREMGFDKLATGHYISKKQKSKKTKKQKIGRYYLYRGKDKEKDQSYFLYNLTQEILAHVEFPLGKYTKKQVKAMAKKWKSPVSEKESQDICFLAERGLYLPAQAGAGNTPLTTLKGGTGKVDHNEFLKKYLKMRKGDIVTLEGEKIGKHNGLPLYTIGQRRAVGIGGTGPYYVARKDVEKNILVVSENRDDKMLYCNKLEAEEVNWISGKEPKFPIKVKAKIRYRHEAAECVVEEKYADGKEGEEWEYEMKEKLACLRRQEIRNFPVCAGRKLEIGRSYIVKFKESQRAVTSGQSIVFYKGEEVLGGGVIF